MVRQFTFLREGDSGRRGANGRLYLDLLRLTHTFNVDLLCFPQLATVLALGDRTAFLLDLVQRSVGMLAVGRPVPLNTGFAEAKKDPIRLEESVSFVGERVPGVFFVAD